MNPTQVIVTLPDDSEVLVDLWPTGAVEAATRPHAGAGWLPVGAGHFGGSVRVVRP